MRGWIFRRSRYLLVAVGSKTSTSSRRASMPPFVTGWITSPHTYSSCSDPTLPPVTADTVTHSPGAPLNVKYLSRPWKFSGDSDNCQAFMVQCELHFELQTVTFPSDWAKVAYIISHLTSRDKVWATAECSLPAPCQHHLSPQRSPCSCAARVSCGDCLRRNGIT